MHIEIDGAAASPEDLWALAASNYGHFTAMQVRERATRGLDLHLSRLAAGTVELFDAELDTERVRALIRHALRDDLDASVRVYVFGPSVLVSVLPPAPAPTSPQRLKSVPYQRPVAQVKHTGGFGQAYFIRQARNEGYDEALLTGPGGVVSEGAITNVGFFAGAGVVWPDAPQLAGITMQLLERQLAGRGVPIRRAPVRLADLGGFDAAFVSNSHGVALVGWIDDVPFPAPAEKLAVLTEAYDAVPWDAL